MYVILSVTWRPLAERTDWKVYMTYLYTDMTTQEDGQKPTGQNPSH